MAKAKKAAAAKADNEARKSGHAKHAKGSGSADCQVTVDRRTAKERRNKGERRHTEAPVAVERRKIERRVKVQRRRQIDPTTCERDYRDEEVEFMNALDQYKRTSGRMFPTCSEVLEVLRSLGYEKRPVVQATAEPVAVQVATEATAVVEMTVMETVAG